MAFKIEIISDVSKVIKGSGDTQKALDKIADTLDDVATEGDQAGRKLERALDAVADEAKQTSRDGIRSMKDLATAMENTADDTDKSFSAMWRAQRREANDAADDMAKAQRRATDDGIDSVGEFKQEAKQNLSEVASSFQGDMTSAVDIVQGTLGGLASVLGPAGMIAAAAGAFGVGLVTSAWQEAQEKAEEFAEQVRDLASEIVDAGSVEALDWSSKLQEAMEDSAESTRKWGDAIDAPKSKLEEWAQIAQAAGVDFADFANGMVGSADKAVDSHKELNKALKDVDQQIAKTEKTATHMGSTETGWQDMTYEVNDANRALFDQREAIIAAQEALTDQNGTLEQAEAQTRLLADAQSGAAASAQAQALAEENLLAATETFSDATVSALESAGAATAQFTTDGSFNIQGYIDHMNSTVSEINTWQANLVTASGMMSQEAMDYVRSLGPEAAPALKAFVDAPLDQQQAMAANWDTIGKASVQGYGDAMAGLSPATRQAVIDAQTEASKGVDVPVKIDGSGLQSELNRVVRGLTIPNVTITPRAGTAQP